MIYETCLQINEKVKSTSNDEIVGRFFHVENI